MRLMVVLALAFAASTGHRRVQRCDAPTAIGTRVSAPCIRDDIRTGGVR